MLHVPPTKSKKAYKSTAITELLKLIYKTNCKAKRIRSFLLIKQNQVKNNNKQAS